MHLVLVGVSHRSAPIELRERLAFRREQVPGALSRLRDELGVREAAILSTCNRVEIYAAAPELDGTVDRLHRFLSEHGQVERSGLAERLYSLTGAESVRHLFSVASGLDSMVLGEAEILHQVKDAYETARAHGAAGKVLHVLFQRALNAAKAVRTRTGIGRGCSSVGSVAVELAGKIFGSLAGTTVLLVGAGKIGELTLKRLAVRGVRDIRIMNRTLERALALAETYRVTPLSLDALPTQLAEADILITSTSAPGYLVGRDAVASAMRARHQRPLCIVDLGVPRNVEPSVGRLENVYLFDIDDLQHLVAHNSQERQAALHQSQAIINEKLEQFLLWWRREISDFGLSIADWSSSSPQSAIRNPQ